MRKTDLLWKIETTDSGKYAIERQIPIITSEVCITAKPFFESKGYKVMREQKRKANVLFLTNYWMKKEL